MIRPALALLLLAAAVPAAAAGPLGFRFEPDAQVELRRLWTASRASGMERVACLAGVMDDDSVRVTRVHALEGWADSLMISARESLEECHPPEWLGTVHTHIALRGGLPYATFSGADRGVNTLWWRRWSVDGTFCVLFSDQDAYCEVDGPHGLRIFPHARY
jgi:hypothetical protein